jgi:uncharacterized membrane protein
VTLLVLGVALWIAGHLFHRLAPDARAGLIARLGANGYRGAVAGVIGLGLVLMVIGYRASPLIQVYTPPPWTIHLNNLLMLAAVALFGMGRSRGHARSWLRHPMLTGVAVWAVAHLLVNGDLASLILFGAMGVWALASMPLINAAEGPWQPPAPGPVSGDIRLALISVAVFAVIAGIHAWLGYWPFPR